MNLFRYQEMATLLIAVLILVIGVDRISRAFRGRLGAAAKPTCTTDRTSLRQRITRRKS
jgi:phosphonate transport system permease protein